MTRQMVVALATLAMAGGAAAEPLRAQAAEPSPGKGCFHVELARAGGETGDAPHFLAVPEVMEFVLYSEFLRGHGGDDSNPHGLSLRAPSFAVWKPVSPDTAIVVWADDSRTLHMRLGATGEALVGTAEMMWHGGTRRETLRATAAPVPCTGP